MQMRLPYHAASLFFSGLAASAIAGLADDWSDWWLLRVVVTRLGALAVGMLMDMMRRISFVRQQAMPVGLAAQSVVSH
jgi:hypothetical protein